MPNYAQERKDAVLSRLLPPNNQPVALVSEEEGIPKGTLYTWRSQAKHQGEPVHGSRPSNADKWTGEAKFAAVIETQPMNASERSAYCRQKGLYPEELERWREACIGATSKPAVDAEPLRKARNEIKCLKRTVERKDKALAESAALLVLSKKFQAMWEDEEM